MKTILRRVLLGMLLAVALYGAWTVHQGLRTMGDVLAHFAWSAFALAVTLAFGNYVLRFLKWEFYLARLGIDSVSKLDSFLTFLSGFVLTVTPGKVGEVFKSFVLAETHGVPVARTAPIVVAERVTDLVGIIILIVLGSLGFRGGLAWAFAGAAVVGVLLTVIASKRLSHGIIGLVERMPGPLGRVGRRVGHKLYEAYDSLAMLVSARNLVVPTLLSIAAWSLECLSLWVILRGFGEETSVALSAFFYATSTLAGALVPVPGGLGITEAALRSQLIELGHVQASHGTAAMLLVRLATLWFAVFVGFGALSLLKRRHPGLLAGADGERLVSGKAPATP